MKVGWLVTAKWTQAPPKQVAPKGWMSSSYDSSNPKTLSFVLFTLECDSGHEAIEHTKKRLDFCFKGIESQFEFQAFRVALLDGERVPSLPLESLESATVEMGDGGKVAVAVG